jgi:hypothetical protein
MNFNEFLCYFFYSQENILHALKIARAQQVQNVKQPAQHKWSYASAFLYSLTLITTIGKHKKPPQIPSTEGEGK